MSLRKAFAGDLPGAYVKVSSGRFLEPPRLFIYIYTYIHTYIIYIYVYGFRSWGLNRESWKRANSKPYPSLHNTSQLGLVETLN